ncbi:hypothetical protein E4T56_gene10941 [Termitomyces sp. T112]|nr:hypothetical protein E4T56_gene10941 [Termitomyces sp. T112]
MPPIPMSICPTKTSQHLQDSLWALGHHDPLSPLTPLVPHPFQCPTLLPTLTTLDPPPPEDPLLLNGPQGLPQAMLANPPVQELQLLVIKLHPSALIILGFSWVCSTNPHIDWPSLTLCFNQDNPTNSGLVPFNISLPSENPKTAINQPLTSIAPLESSPSLLTAVPLAPFPKASLVAAIPFCLQSTLYPNVSDHSTSTSRATQSSSTPRGNSEVEENAPPPQSPLIKSRWLPPNIPWNQYKGPQYPNQPCLTLPDNSATTPGSPTATPLPTSADSKNLDIKIIGAILFACILQDSTPAFQLQITPALPEKHLHAETTLPECKMEEQILYEVVPPEYYEFADVFSEESAKELPLHHSYDYKINFKEGASPLFGKIYNMSKIKLQALKEYLDDMLGKGFICPLISTTSTPVLFAKKKGGSLQLCVDY